MLIIPSNALTAIHHIVSATVMKHMRLLGNEWNQGEQFLTNLGMVLIYNSKS